MGKRMLSVYHGRSWERFRGREESWAGIRRKQINSERRREQIQTIDCFVGTPLFLPQVWSNTDACFAYLPTLLFSSHRLPSLPKPTEAECLGLCHQSWGKCTSPISLFFPAQHEIYIRHVDHPRPSFVVSKWPDRNNIWDLKPSHHSALFSYRIQL